MEARACVREQVPSYGGIIELLLCKGLIEEAEPPLLSGDLWHRVKRQLDGCFVDAGDIVLGDNDAIIRFRELFEPVYQQLLDMAGMGVLCYENCITTIRKNFASPKTPDFAAVVCHAANRTGTSSLAILTLRAIRIMTIAIELGLISPVS